MSNYRVATFARRRRGSVVPVATFGPTGVVHLDAMLKGLASLGATPLSVYYAGATDATKSVAVQWDDARTTVDFGPSLAVLSGTPTFDGTQVNFATARLCSGGSSQTGSAYFAFSQAPMTLVLLAHQTPSTAGSVGALQSQLSADSIEIGAETQPNWFGSDVPTTVNWTSGQSISASALQLLFRAWSGTTSYMEVPPHVQVTHAITAKGTGNGMVVLGGGPVAGPAPSCAVRAAFVLPGLYTPAIRDVFNTWLAGIVSWGADPIRSLLVCDGNSLTLGAHASNQAKTSYPADLRNTISRRWTIKNTGVSGETTGQMDTAATTNVDPLFSAGRPNNVIVAWEGSNDLDFGPNVGNPTGAFNALVAYATHRRAAGYGPIYMGTLLPRDESGVSPTFEADRQSLNTMIRNAVGTSWDGVLDVAADPRIGAPGACNNTAFYFTDTVHLIDAGYAIVAAMAAAIVNRITV